MVGCRVLVPLGRRLVTGYVLGPSPPLDPKTKIRPISSILDSQPLFPATMVPFFRWITEYYHYPLGEVIRGALPAGLTSSSGWKTTLDPEKKQTTMARYPVTEGPDWLTTLYERNELSPAATRKIRAKARDRKLLEAMAEEGLLTIVEVLTGATTGSKSEICVRLLTQPHPVEGLKKSEQRTLDSLAELAAITAGPVSRANLASLYSGARAALKTLAERGIVTLEEQPVYRDPFGEPPLYFAEPDQLTPDQEAVMATLKPTLGLRKFAPFLLHGVTGCGKTEIYLKAADITLTKGRSVLVMVPEIALATQLEGHFFSRFGDRVALIHSGLTTGERYDQWQRIVSGQAPIIIGARSAIFAPLTDPGLIIVDEEHDGAYKQEDGLRYQGRDLAVLRASLEKCPIILGSATPSVTSFHHAANGKYTLLTMPRRIENREMPPVTLIDLKKIPTVSGRPPLFSRELVRAIKENLAEGNQSLVFLNRRGFASLLICQSCGQPLSCPHCQISMTLHQGRGELACHYCGHTAPSSTICPNCRSTKLVAIGFGTERVEAELIRLFPEARIARLDRDTTLKRTDFLATLKAVHNREIDILVGTQMITKGHHFPHVTLVGVIWADAGLGLPDFRSGERTYQLLSQVTGRAGRGEKPGRVLVQALVPDHYAIRSARDHDYQALYEQEISQRRALGYPPFGRLINLRFEGSDNQLVRTLAEKTAKTGAELALNRYRIEILGPAPAPLARLRDRFRWQLLLKGKDTATLQAFCRELLVQCPAGSGGDLKMTVDVDPENML